MGIWDKLPEGLQDRVIDQGHAFGV
jgi:hypothetical protein